MRQLINIIFKRMPFQPLVFFFLFSINSSCQTTNTKDKIILEKNECYILKLEGLKNTHLYAQVMTGFNDTFLVLKKRKEYFGVPEVVSNKIDEAMFFKKDSSECMLIVLQRTQFDLVFGTARMIRGFKKDSKWNFEVSMEFSFGNGYFDLFKENNFDDISKIARYSVLTEGNYKRRGCEIDDYYWFTELKK